jgi:hypothetical protein
MINITLWEAVKSNLISPAAISWVVDNLEYLNKPMTLLSSSYKTKKGEKLGFTTGILYLQPAAKVSAKTVCPAAKMAGCEKDCLISSGQLGMSVAQNAATKRTVLMLLRPDEFNAQLNAEIAKLAAKHKDRLAIRLNGTSDLDWTHIINANPTVTMYDYTKIEKRMAIKQPANYSLTYSASPFSKASRSAAARAIRLGYKTVLAFNTKELASEYKRPTELADYDETDLRFLPEGCIGALTRKGSSKADRAIDEVNPSFFYTPKTYADLIKVVQL